MGNVGISFGSPTSGQGFDVTSTVNQIVANLQAIETPWQNQLTSLQSQDTALTGIGTDLGTLSTSLSALTDVGGVLSEKEGSSSDTSVIALTSASSSAVAGSYTVEVSQIAQTSSYSTNAIASTDTLGGALVINGQSITISDGTATDSNGNPIPANNTLATLASYINSGDYGVTANVIAGSSGSQLALVSNTSGVAGDITVDSSDLTDSTTGGSIGFTLAQTGQDALLTVDGISLSSPSNTVTDAIPGVTFQVLGTSSADTPVQVEITNDNSDVESAVGSFVSAYNTVVQDLTTQEGDDSSGNPEPLDGNPAIATLQEQLEGALTFTQSSGAITSLTQLGITVNSDGTLSLDTSTLDSALNSNYQDVANFFQSSGSFGGNFTNTLDNLGDTAPDGEIYLQLQQIASQQSTLNTDISNENTSISAQKSELTTELNEANYTLQEIPSQVDEVNELYSAITGYNENTNG